MNRREFIASAALLPAVLAEAQSKLPANKNIKWALTTALWNYQPKTEFNSILDIMRDTGFIGVRMTGFPRVLEAYGLTLAQMHTELD